MFINLNGKAKEAMDFYAKAFNTEVKNVMTYGQTPSYPNMPIKEEDKDLIMYGEVQMGDKNIMFMDGTAEWPVTPGNILTPVISVTERSEVDRLFAALSEGGKQFMAPGKMFFSEHYAMLEDKFGITWHIMLAGEPAL